MKFDIIIVGASVAGCSAAIALSKHNLKILLLEKSPIGRDKPCGEGLLPAGVSVLKRLGALHLTEKIEAQPFYGVGFEFEGNVAQSDFPSGNAFGVRRKKLDQELFLYASSLPNVVTRERCKVEGLLFSNNGFISGVALPNGERAFADVVVAADGLASTLRHATGLDGSFPTRRRYGMRVHFALPNAKPFGNYVRVLLAPPCEYYFTPVGPNEMQVAFLGDPAKQHLSKQNFVQHLVTHPRLKEALSGAEQTSEVMGAGPFGRKSRGVVLDGFALLGDAAGYVDAVTGEGMELALRSTEALTETIVSALQSGGPSKENLLPYAKARLQIVQDPDRLTKIVLLLAGFPFLIRRAIRSLNQKPELFQKLLSIQGGEAKLSSLSLRDWLSLL